MLSEIPVLILDCTKDFENSPDYARHLSEQVREFMMVCHNQKGM